MKRRNELFETAEELGIEIVNARTKNDANIAGLHLLNPDMDELEHAIFTVETSSFNIIVIHSRQTWIYDLNKQTVEVGHKLLA